MKRDLDSRKSPGSAVSGTIGSVAVASFFFSTVLAKWDATDDSATADRPACPDRAARIESFRRDLAARLNPGPVESSPVTERVPTSATD